MTSTDHATAMAIAAGHPSARRQVPDSQRGGARESAVTPTPPPGRRDLQGPCIEWTGGRNSHGYGRCWRDGRDQYMHRIAWEEAHGPIPAGMFVCHHCDNPPCINIAHLFLGTPRDNTRDMDAKGRRSKDAGGGALFGEANPSAKLTREQVREIRARYRSGGISQETLSSAYGVSPSHIHRIIHENNWPSDAGGAAAPPAPFDDFHATVTSINEAADRLRALKDRKSSSLDRPADAAEVEAASAPAAPITQSRQP